MQLKIRWLKCEMEQQILVFYLPYDFKVIVTLHLISKHKNNPDIKNLQLKYVYYSVSQSIYIYTCIF